MRSAKTKKAFIKYLKEHPEERFWQAVRNFSGRAFILAAHDPAGILEDTFNWEENPDIIKEHV